ncbi:MAG: 23S rRNA (adenine(2030)-N(6))-methyltransferase RlmJ [Candidatus Binatia bacterium]
MSQSSRYRPDQTSDYSHRFHAGNVGDVWKHLVLVEVLRRARELGPVSYVESHAGEGEYALGPTGEWTEGIGRLWVDGVGLADAGTDALAHYTALCRSLGSGAARPERYPGSPLLARTVLGPEADLTLFERDAEACERLRAVLGETATTQLICADGLAALPEVLRAAEARGAAVVTLVDPPFTQKPDWTVIPEVVIAAAQATTRATILFWYPVKSLTRPNAMIARCKTAGVSATVAELVTTPLEHQRQRLNGSGLVLVRPPAGTLAAIAAAAAPLGERCATRAGVWSLRLASW